MANVSKLNIPKVEPVDLSRLPVELPKITVDYSRGGGYIFLP